MSYCKGLQKVNSYQKTPWQACTPSFKIDIDEEELKRRQRAHILSLFSNSISSTFKDTNHLIPTESIFIDVIGWLVGKEMLDHESGFYFVTYKGNSYLRHESKAYNVRHPKDTFDNHFHENID